MRRLTVDRYYMVMADGAPLMESAAMVVSGPTVAVNPPRVRQNFPETWIFDLGNIR